MNINKEKLQYVTALKDAISTVSKTYDLLPVMLGYVAYREYGGDHMWQDYVAHRIRSISESVPFGLSNYTTSYTGVSENTSFGNISMQLRRAAESLDYYGEIEQAMEKELIKLLNDEKTAIILVARHLEDLKNYDFKNVSINKLTDDEIAIVVGRCNMGYSPSKETVLNGAYAKDFLQNKTKIESYLK